MTGYNLTTIIGFLAAVSTTLISAVPLISKPSDTQISDFTVLILIFNYVFWIGYGFIKYENFILIQNIICFILMQVSLVRNQSGPVLVPKHLTKYYIGGVVLFCASFLAVTFEVVPVDVYDWLCVLMSLCVFGSPLRDMQSVLVNRNAGKVFSLKFSVIGAVSTGLWVGYGWLKQIVPVWLPNGV